MDIDIIKLEDKIEDLLSKVPSAKSVTEYKYLVISLRTLNALYNDLTGNYYKVSTLGNHFYNKYNTYNVIDLNNVCNDINGNIINLNEVCKDLENRIYIFTKENTKLVYIGVISPVHTMTDVLMANVNHYT